MPSFANIHFFFFLSADLPQDFNDLEPSMDATFDDASKEFMEAKSVQLVVEDGII